MRNIDILNEVIKLKEIGKKCRKTVLKMVMKAGEGHIASSFSCIDIVLVLYFSIMKIDPKNPKCEERDRFILSKGHGCGALYAVLGHRGFYPIRELDTVNQKGTAFGGHPDRKKVPGIEVSSGSLGHGLSVGVGMALATKKNSNPYRVFVLMGDGECQEGSIWEAAMFAPASGLDNLVGVVDFNGLQAIGTIADTLSLNPLAKKWEAFGWAVKEIDGHNYSEILEVFKKVPFEKGKPSLIIANTVKGMGVSFMENKIMWHARATTKEEYELALKELDLPKQ